MNICHELFHLPSFLSRSATFRTIAFSLLTLAAYGQNPAVSTPGPLAQLQQRGASSTAPDQNHIAVGAVTQESEGSVHRLRGHAVVQTTDMVLRADEIDYDQKTGYAEARGNVSFDHFAGGEHIEADRVEYNVNDETGKYYNVRGSSPAKLETRPGILTTTSPFSFQGKWAERIENRYILHEGFITNCKLPKPWWILRGPTFDVIPGQRAIARNSVFWLRRVPLFYTPVFYKSLERAPRQSGLLTPNMGNSSRRGKMMGAGYYWAINRSYDAMYRAQLFTQRGFAHTVDFRGKPTEHSDFNYSLYGVNDRGPIVDDGVRGASQGGFFMNFTGKADLGHGFYGRGQFTYLSSFLFRQAFTESFFEAISSEVHSLGSVSKYWSTFGLNFVASRVETFQSTNEGDKVSIRRLPSVEFNSRDRQISERILPVWVSFRSSASLVRRHQLTYETKQLVDREDVEPRVTTALRWKDFHLIPSFSLRETNYGASFDTNRQLSGQGILRSSREFSADLIMPSLARIFEKPPAWLGERLKHVIEPRASFRYVSGIGSDFQRLIRIDETELLSDTNELEVSLSNRIYSKYKDGRVEEVLSWELAHRRYFDPCFGGRFEAGRCIGGALIEGERNVLLSTASLTGITFLDVARRYSPISSALRLTPKPGFGLEWRTDYDPKRGHLVNSNFSASGRFTKDYFVTVGHNQIRSVPLTRVDELQRYKGLSSNSNQFFGMLGFGQENRRGWSTGLLSMYDYRQKVMPFASVQVTYNTDCCGYSVQYRRLNFGNRDEKYQFRVAFAIANIGSFGTLRRQERMF